MIRIMVMANDSLLVDVIGSILAVEIGPDVLQLTYRLPRHIQKMIRHPRSMVIMIDEGGLENEQFKMPDSFRPDRPVLLIKASLKTMNIDIYKSYELTRLGSEPFIELVREFIRTYLKKRKGYEEGRFRNQYDMLAAKPPAPVYPAS